MVYTSSMQPSTTPHKPPKPQKAIVGLTGGIGSGKSTVARMFVDEGVQVVDADRLAREVVAAGTDGLDAIVRRFGVEYLQPDGSLDRTKLGARIFADPSERQALNDIVHPRIRRLSEERLRHASEHTSEPYVMYDAALLVEEGIYKQLAALIVVAASEETQITRVMQRDHTSRQDVVARLRAQLPLANKVHVADYVIDNDGTLDDTRAQVRATHHALRARFTPHPQATKQG